jgi:hypothetical protein
MCREKSITTHKIRTLFSLLLFVVCLMIVPFAVKAEEVNWLVPPSFEGDELAKVREWEKTWVGKTIDRNNIDQVKEFISDGVYNVMTDSSKWNNYDFSFNVVPYHPYRPTPGLIEATRKYSPLAKFTAEDCVENYQDLAGTLFPKPKTGLEVAWNYFTWSRGDDFIRPDGKGTPVDARTKIERGAINTYWMSFYVNRVDKPPLPKVPKNRRGIRKARFMSHDAPPHMQGFNSLHIHYIDLKKEFDGWFYWPRFRKISRVQTDVRDDVIDGMDWITDDFPDGWDDNPDVANYKLLGRQKLLVGRNVDTDSFEREKGMVMFRKVQRELVNTYVVEVTHKTPGYVYGKQLWFVDPETWAILFKTVYNKEGEFWKIIEIYTELRDDNGTDRALVEGYAAVDFIRTHGTVNVSGNTDITTKWSREKTFSIRNLDRRSY